MVPVFTEKLIKLVNVEYRHWSLDQKISCICGRSLVWSRTRLSISTVEFSRFCVPFFLFFIRQFLTNILGESLMALLGKRLKTFWVMLC
jgi:hypothetical protein